MSDTSKIVPLFVEDEITGMLVPNVKPKPLFVLMTRENGRPVGVRCTEQRAQAIGWLAEAVSKTDNPDDFWVDVI